MLSQFNANPDYPEHATLPPELAAMQVKPVGRLDYDSEGLLLLTDDPKLEKQLLDPSNKKRKVYLAQVEGEPSQESLDLLHGGGLEIRVNKKAHTCAPVKAELLTTAPKWLWKRTPPVDANIETSWLQLTLTEGKNRQVRRMTAALGHATLRLIRTNIAEYELEEVTSARTPSPL